MWVTADTSHSPIGPRDPSEQSPIGDVSIHSLTAFLSCSLDFGPNAAAALVRKQRVVGLELGSELGLLAH